MKAKENKDGVDITLSENEARWLYMFIWQNTWVHPDYIMMQNNFLKALDNYDNTNNKRVELYVE